MCITIFLCKQSTFARKKGLFWKTIENFQFASFKEQRPSLIYFCLVKEIIKLTNSQIQEDKNVVQYLDGYIANNFLELVTAFEKLAETYKNDFLKWDNVLDFKKFL